MVIGRLVDSTLAGREQGYTLFEVILVLIIVSVLTVVILSRNNPNASRARLQGQAELLKTQLRYAQSRALNANQVWGMTASGNQVILFNGGSTSNPVILPGENTTPLVYGAGDLADLSVNDFTVSFDDRGRPCTDAGCTSLATGDITVTVSLASSSLTPVPITITQNTGFIQ